VYRACAATVKEGRMKAIRFHEHGGPDVLQLEDVAEPALGPGEVLLRVRAVSVMRTLDCEVRSRRGAYGPIPMPHILGADPAGEVARTSEGVTELSEGDRVVTIQSLWCGTCRRCLDGRLNACTRSRIFGVHTQGGYAQYTAVPARNLIRVPETLSFEQATAMMTTVPVAWHLLVERAHVRPGETVLIMPAGGALGTAGIQVAKLAGARVIAAAGADWKLDQARQLGADAAVNYNTSRLSTEVKRLTDGQGVDVVFENLSVKPLWDESLASAAVLGRIVTCGALGGGTVDINMRAFYLNHLSLIGARGARLSDIALVYQLAGEGKLLPAISRCLPLTEAAAAHALVESRDVFGRVVLTVE
jgi:NADPH:quinone reductase-like Zn-dependent oxidoreductase